MLENQMWRNFFHLFQPYRLIFERNKNLCNNLYGKLELQETPNHFSRPLLLETPYSHYLPYAEVVNSEDALNCLYLRIQR